MKYLRKKDSVCYRLSSMQARIFEKSSVNNIPSFYFIRTFMYSFDAEQLDNLNYLTSGSSELEIYLNVSKAVKMNRGTIYPSYVMHWIGYFYRTASYLINLSSRELFIHISPTYLNKVYDAYHGLDIVKAIETVFSDLNYEPLSPNQRFKEIYLKTKFL